MVWWGLHKTLSRIGSCQVVYGKLLQVRVLSIHPVLKGMNYITLCCFQEWISRDSITRAMIGSSVLQFCPCSICLYFLNDYLHVILIFFRLLLTPAPVLLYHILIFFSPRVHHYLNVTLNVEPEVRLFPTKSISL